MSNNSTVSKLSHLTGLQGAKKLVHRLATEECGVHAVLFYGAAGSGKEVLAEILAQAWLCRKPGPEGACGECQACLSFERGTCADLLNIRPAQPSNIIRLGAIQYTDSPKDAEDFPTPLIPFFRTPPLMSRHKVASLTDAHRMNRDSSNALLKTLEEPHPHAKLILTTDSVGSVLPTILSRCLAVACAVPELDELRANFPEATEEDIRLAEGTPGRLARLLEKPDSYRLIAQFAKSLKSRKIGDALVVSEEFRQICDKVEAVQKRGARTSNAETLSLLATFLAREPGVNPNWPQFVIEAHRKIQGNVSAGLVFDALFAQLLGLSTRL